MSEVKLYNIGKWQHLLREIKLLYVNSFPIEERREWTGIECLLQTEMSGYNMKVIMHNNQFAGFISWWKFDCFCYVEHFAINHNMRGKGTGAQALMQFINEVKSAVVLEVELPQEGEMARRRIDFYCRNGFVAHSHFNYIQPPYSKELPSVPLMLMTANAPANIDLNHIASTLHNKVYDVNS